MFFRLKSELFLLTCSGIEIFFTFYINVLDVNSVITNDQAVTALS